MSEIRASIDIGSNSVLLLIAKLDNNNIEVLDQESTITGLGRELDKNKVFLQESMDETFDAFKIYINKCAQYNIKASDIIVTATEASRVAQNAFDFFQMVNLKLGLKIITITGLGEAYYSTKGILLNNINNKGSAYILDIGGASSEVIKVNLANSKIEHSFSMPLGAVRCTNWIEEDCLESKLENIFINFRIDLDKCKTENMLCVAGTMTSIANMILKNETFVEEQVNGFHLSKDALNHIYEETKLYKADDFLNEFKFLGKRSKSILGGMIVARKIFEWLGVKDSTISTYGLRYGTLLEGKISDEFKYLR